MPSAQATQGLAVLLPPYVLLRISLAKAVLQVPSLRICIHA